MKESFILYETEAMFEKWKRHVEQIIIDGT